ncbi:MAG: S9 family peptidase [Chlorobiaceae bacterium]|nr:S9 family peptidase [Chlorobiaceae bacterium]MBA4310396.1 S9 family peptidase [Chlorobiaceae bacterium]
MKLLILLTICFLFNNSYSQKLNYPETRKVDQVDEYFGKKIADPFRWLEDDRAPEVKEWVTKQNEVTFNFLENIPFRNQIKEHLQNSFDYPRYSAPFREGENYFFFRNDGLQNQSIMFIQKGLDGTPEVLIDPNKFSEDGTVRLSSTSISPDGKKLAYSISRSGSDWQEIYVLDIETKTRTTDSLAWIKFSRANWHRDGFYYSRYDVPEDADKTFSEKNEFHKVYYHKLGTPQSEDRLVYEDSDPLKFFSVSITEDERFMFLYGSGKGQGNSLAIRNLKDGEKNFTKIIDAMDYQYWVIENFDDKIILFTNKNAPNGKLVMYDAANPKSEMKDFIAEKEFPLDNISFVGGKFFLTYMRDVTHHVFAYDRDGKFLHNIDLPGLGTVSGFGGKMKDEETFYTFTSYNYPPTIFKYDIKNSRTELFRKSEVKFEPKDFEVKQLFYPSKDGTKIPMFVMHKKGIELNGKNPTILYGYGGFNASMNPAFSPTIIAWMQMGGVYAVANLRGGSEYGEKWHEAGMLLNKQNVFDDFIFAAKFLIEKKYTSSDYIAINGVSNGGLLVGTVINQRPELFRVAIPEVGVMDMLRYEKFTIGWNWAPEYGSVKDSVHFENLLGYSPLHNISEKINYPAVMITTADHDDRVVPAHSFKYAAQLQKKYKGDDPILLRIETRSGHGASSVSKSIELNADKFSFIFYVMGLKPKL